MVCEVPELTPLIKVKLKGPELFKNSRSWTTGNAKGNVIFAIATEADGAVVEPSFKREEDDATFSNKARLVRFAVEVTNVAEGFIKALFELLKTRGKKVQVEELGERVVQAAKTESKKMFLNATLKLLVSKGATVHNS
jgi:hypothetical protein